MPDIAAISGLLSSLKASTDLTKAMLGIRDAQLVREKAVELTAEIMSAQQSAMAAQSAQAELSERVRQLEKQVVELEDWHREKQRYELAEVAPGVFAYTTKAGMEGTEPPHKICAHCYEDRRKSILQASHRAGHMRTNSFLVCNACKAEVLVSTRYLEIPAPAVPRRDWFDRS